MPAPPLVSCHECDLLQRETPLPRGGIARCRRCGAELYRSHPDSLERTLAITLAALVLFAIANAYPIVGLEVQGNRTAATLFGAVRALWGQGAEAVAGLVFVTTIVVPLLEMSITLLILVPLRLGGAAPATGLLLRIVQAVRPWGLVEVFILGVLVSLVKLAHQATVIPGIALWSFAGLMLLFAAAAASFDPREVWKRLGPPAPESAP